MEDAARALIAALEPGRKGVYNVVGPGEVPLSSVFEELGSRPRSVPHLLARPLLSTLFKYRLAEYPPEELDHIQFLCMVDGSRWAKEAKWAPKYSMRETIQAVLPDTL
jgi:UDP-glucose 4-epimerase